jgi:transposase-like protein
MTRRKRRKFTAEHKGEAVRLVQTSGESVYQIAQDLDLTETALRRRVEKPLRKGQGTRFLNPETRGEALMIEEGWPGATDPLHVGPYLRVSRDGKIVRIPLAGNPVLKP